MIREPLGGAHRDMDAIAVNLKNALLENLEYFDNISLDKILEQRYQRLMKFGAFEIKT